ncbi:hypothetical protein BpHYR1_015738 [Brachionus plicatilis]|uniref:Uncharacterized protein n=1 Tax=Brachionus plicatilis TaxID=10195 RepID=A0A3M7PWU5_BRAPC|nr:hypothetical protein BpHYR1_015738 [Brachionus plicatilis]
MLKLGKIEQTHQKLSNQIIQKVGNEKKKQLVKIVLNPTEIPVIQLLCPYRGYKKTFCSFCRMASLLNKIKSKQK